jgi:hypothetical protein
MPAVPPMPHLPPGAPPAPPPPPTVVAMDIPIERLRGFVAAISRFWRDHEYIYNESVGRKDECLERRLAKERLERDWVPQADPNAS